MIRRCRKKSDSSAIHRQRRSSGSSREFPTLNFRTRGTSKGNTPYTFSHARRFRRPHTVLTGKNIQTKLKLIGCRSGVWYTPACVWRQWRRHTFAKRVVTFREPGGGVPARFSTAIPIGIHWNTSSNSTRKLHKYVHLLKPTLNHTLTQKHVSQPTRLAYEACIFLKKLIRTMLLPVLTFYRDVSRASNSAKIAALRTPTTPSRLLSFRMRPHVWLTTGTWQSETPGRQSSKCGMTKGGPLSSTPRSDS